MPAAHSAQPHHQQIQALLQRGIALAEAGDLGSANGCFVEVTRLDPKNHDAWHLQALAAVQARQPERAIELFTHTLKLKPNFAEAHNNLGNMFREAGKHKEAADAYRKAVRLRPDNAVFHSNLGSGLHQLGEFDAARKAFGKAVHLDPGYADAWCNLAVVLGILGEKKEKIAACEKTLELKPYYGQALQMLAQDRRWSEKDARYAQMETYADDPSVPLEDRINIGFGLGKINEDLEEYDAAFHYYQRANLLKRQTISLDIHQTQLQLAQIMQLCSKEWIAVRAEHGHKDARPVFIVGLPRSGTTLIEQVLDRHSNIHGAGELLHIPQIVRGVERDAHMRYPACMQRVPDPVYAQMGAHFMKEVNALAPNVAHIIDKMPGNFAHVGLIKAILPQAKIIWCRRDARDNAISIYKRQFGGFVPYAYDLYEIGRMVALSERMRAHWSEALPEGDFIEVAYEDVVADIEKQARRLTTFLGVEWEEACLSFHENKRAVTTASYEQVRQPLYDRSVGVWKHYETHLQPFEAGYHAYASVPLL